MNGNFLLLFSFVEISGIAQSSRKINQIQGLGLYRPKTGAKWVWGNSKSVQHNSSGFGCNCKVSS
jgi:hypothetical protein